MKKRNIIILLILGAISIIFIILSFINLLAEYQLYSVMSYVEVESESVNSLLARNTAGSNLLYGCTLLVSLLTVVVSVIFFRRK